MPVKSAEDALSGRLLLSELLPQWQSLLQGWSASGQLTAAAQEALQLQGEPRTLRRLVAQWASGDFRSLPPIELLSAQDISGAMGAYAISTGTIYLNRDWLQTASQEQVFAVLTEELGHHLDGVLNAVDTAGDEGEYFARLMLGSTPTTAESQLLRLQQDNSHVFLNTGAIAAEQSLASPHVLHLDFNSQDAITDRSSSGNKVTQYGTVGLHDGKAFSMEQIAT